VEESAPETEEASSEEPQPDPQPEPEVDPSLAAIEALQQENATLKNRISELEAEVANGQAAAQEAVEVLRTDHALRLEQAVTESRTTLIDTLWQDLGEESAPVSIEDIALREIQQKERLAKLSDAVKAYQVKKQGYGALDLHYEAPRKTPEPEKPKRSDSENLKILFMGKNAKQ
jgi:predicted RNase H-like nuclease (RuvC/YqgF family)